MAGSVVGSIARTKTSRGSLRDLQLAILIKDRSCSLDGHADLDDWNRLGYVWVDLP